MFIKEAVVNVANRFLTEKQIKELQNSLIVHLVFFTTLKNYLYQCATEENLFVIPETVRSKASKNKLILVLDMDQTLVHTRSQKKPSHRNYIETTFQGEQMYIETRPHSKQFLKACSEIFTIYIYTAGKKRYADAVLDAFDDEGLITQRYYRDTCRKSNGILVKDLRYLKKISKSKQEMILIDDNSDSVNNNYPFALKIEAFQGCQEDKELLNAFGTVLKFYH